MSQKTYQNIGVIGAGAWGTALAQTLASARRNVTIWGFEKECVNAINTAHENKLYLAGVPLSPHIKATDKLEDLINCDALLSVTPAQHMRSTLAPIIDHLKEGVPVMLCSKGIEISSQKFMSDVLTEMAPHVEPAVLSGPSFAIDVAKGLPTAVTLACANEEVGKALSNMIATPHFRPYLAHDVLGAEIGGAVKNVLAIACGLVLGLGLGRSAHAAIIARGFAEMRRLGRALGADSDTLAGLCGLGDLVLTCSSEQSRNMSCGLALGRGEALADIMAARAAVTEGVATAPALKTLAKTQNVDMPISMAIADILSGETQIPDALSALLARDLKREAP